MDIQFKLEGGAWISEFHPAGPSYVMLARQWADDFRTYYGKDKASLIEYEKGRFYANEWERQNVGFHLDVPAGCLIRMESKSPVISCTVTEKVVKTSGGTSAIPEASHESDGLMASTDKAKLDGIEPEANKYVLAAASGAALGGVMLGHVNKALYEYPVELDGEGRAYVSVPQRELSGMQRIEFESYANDYAGIWATSVSDVTHMDFVMGDNIDAGNINDTFRWRFTSNNLLGSKVAKPQESDLHTIMELLPHGAKAGELKIADAAGALQHVLTKADFASIPAEVTSANIVDVLKQIVGILKP